MADTMRALTCTEVSILEKVSMEAGSQAGLTA